MRQVTDRKNVGGQKYERTLISGVARGQVAVVNGVAARSLGLGALLAVAVTKNRTEVENNYITCEKDAHG